jgi:CHRD domain
MRKIVITALAAAVTCACSESTRTPATPTELTAPLQVQAAQPDGTAKNHATHLSGDQEVLIPPPPAGTPTPADSQAQGQAHFKVSNDRTSVDYKLIASNIDNVIMAHIHCGRPGTNGGIVVWLYPSPTQQSPAPAGAGRHDGVLAEGTFSAAHVLAAPDSDACPGGVQAGSLDDVLARIEAGGTYVNVHTNDGAAPGNTGPGDFPPGEIRGQLDK